MNNQTAEKLLEKVKSDYNKIAGDFDSTRKHNWKEFLMFLKYIKEGDRVADIGCGNGRFYGFLENNYKQFNYFGIDNSEELIKIANKNYAEARFLVGDILDVPLNNETQDIVVSIAALHHIPSHELRQKAVKEMSRVLRKGGYLLITNWNLFQPKYYKYICQARLRSIFTFGKYNARDTLIPWGKGGIRRYYYAFKENELRELLLRRFEILKFEKGNNFVFVCRKK